MNGDGKVDVSDLGILAANYGLTAGGTWETGDFNGDGVVDVSDLGILAASYGAGTGGSLDFSRDARALGLPFAPRTVSDSEEKVEQMPALPFACGQVGLIVVTSVILIGLRR